MTKQTTQSKVDRVQVARVAYEAARELAWVAYKAACKPALDALNAARAGIDAEIVKERR